MKLEEQLTYQTAGVPSILSILPNRPVSQGLNRERSSFFLSATSLRSSRLRRSRSLLTRALDLPGWSENKRKWNYIFRLKAIFQPDRSFLFRFDPNFDNFSAENENFLKWNGKFRSDDRTDGSKRTTSGGGQVDHFERKISPRTEAFHFFLHRNIRNFWHNGKHPLQSGVSFDIQTTRNLVPRFSYLTVARRDG